MRRPTTPASKNRPSGVFATLLPDGSVRAPVAHLVLAASLAANLVLVALLYGSLPSSPSIRRWHLGTDGPAVPPVALQYARKGAKLGRRGGGSAAGDRRRDDESGAGTTVRGAAPKGADESRAGRGADRGSESEAAAAAAEAGDAAPAPLPKSTEGGAWKAPPPLPRGASPSEEARPTLPAHPRFREPLHPAVPLLPTGDGTCHGMVNDVRFAVVSGHGYKTLKAQASYVSWGRCVSPDKITYYSEENVKEWIPQQLVKVMDRAESMPYHLLPIREYECLKGGGAKSDWLVLVEEDTFVNLRNLDTAISEHARKN